MTDSHKEDLALAERIQYCWEDVLPNLEPVFSAGSDKKRQDWAVDNFGVPTSMREKGFLERQQLPVPLLLDIIETLENLPGDKRVTADEKALQAYAEKAIIGVPKSLQDGVL